jgi:hypothetical protein
MVAAAAACALGVPTDVAFGGTSSREVARALRTDPVYVAESQRRLLPVPERGRLRLRIAQRDAGRIQVAVVPTQAARGASGLRELANAVDQAMPGRRGALVLTTGTAFHVVTSHSAVHATAGALQAAVQTHRRQGLDAQLLAAVDRIATVDPETAGDVPVPGIVDIPVPGVPPAARTPHADTFLHDVGESFRLAVLIAAAAAGLPFLLWALAQLHAWRRRRRANRDSERLEHHGAREELIVLAEQIGAFDIEVTDAGQHGRDEYEQALNLYDRASRLLSHRHPTDAELHQARCSLAEARSRLATAREALPTGRAPARIGRQYLANGADL